MIPVIRHGTHFYGILHYALHKEGARLLGEEARSAHEISDEMEHLLSLNDRVKKPVFHMSLAIHPEEYLQDSDWVDVVKTMLEGLGYDNQPYVVIRHTDEPHDHVHVIASRIRYDGSVTRSSYEWRRASDLASDLERKYGLRKAALSGAERSSRGHGENQSQYEVEMIKRGETPYKQEMKLRISAAIQESITLGGFVMQLDAFGVGVKFNIGGSHVSGVSYEWDGNVIRGSKLGKQFSWRGLLQQLDYDPERDLAIMTSAAPKASRMALHRSETLKLQRITLRKAAGRVGVAITLAMLAKRVGRKSERNPFHESADDPKRREREHDQERGDAW